MIRIAIADDHRIFIDGLQAILSHQADMELVGVAGNGRQLLGQIPHLRPTVLLLDLSMPEMNGEETARRLTAEYPEVRVIVLSMHDDFGRIRTMLELGVVGYLLKDSAANELLEAIRTVAQGGTYYSRQVTQSLIEGHRKLGAGSALELKIELTAREREVLALIAQSCTTQEIASRLFISSHTVETHRKNLLAKTGNRNSVGLVAWAKEQGLA